MFRQLSNQHVTQNTLAEKRKTNKQKNNKKRKGEFMFYVTYVTYICTKRAKALLHSPRVSFDSR